MSTYPTTIRARAQAQSGRSLAVWAALAAALVGTVVVLVLTIPDHNAPSGGAVTGGRTQSVAPHNRFDGGPNEGTRGALSRQPVDSPATRFDGGPQEGTRGTIITSNPVAAPTFDRGPRAGHVGDVVTRSQLVLPGVSQTRFDGGPDEGTRGAAVQYSGSTRFDGGPDEGTRGR